MLELVVDESEPIVEVIEPIDLATPRFGDFHAYWDSLKKPAGGMPALSDINLMDIYKLAPWIVILDVISGENPSTQFRWRYVGTQLRETLFAVELTGQFVHNLSNLNWAELIQDCYEKMVSNPSPHMWRCQGKTFTDEPEPIHYSRLLFPLGGQSGAVEHLIGIYMQSDP